ncbi:MAG: lactate racemase domain-containing protein [Planctomycetota bacterium]|nr:lactate racemase domain-containing protein [Planctomycetota bacterium]
MVIGKGVQGQPLSDAEVKAILAEGLAKANLAGKRVLVIIPDSTRTAPLPLFFKLLYELIGKQVKQLDYLIALGTHMSMSDEAINRLVGNTPAQRKKKYKNVRIFNHEWQRAETLAKIGHISAEEISAISGGLMSQGVDVTINKLIFEYDQLLICGPVFPHEVVGFSGGNKYFFPGIAGPDVINMTHWIGALITIVAMIGVKHTPVRAVIDRAASFVTVPKLCVAFVVTGHDLAGVFVGSPEEAWAAAADVSAREHIIYVAKPYRLVVSVMPRMYDDLWTAAKGMYKMEPAIADGGEVIIYAPHLDEISYTHGKVIDKVGYHCRDFFVKQWDKYCKYPWGVLAHSTHLKGAGTYENGVERFRITVTLATKIPEARCRQVNLGYRDPASIKLDDFKGRESEGVLLVPKAGEMLYRLR